MVFSSMIKSINLTPFVQYPPTIQFIPCRHYGYIGYTENRAGVEIVQIRIMLVVVVLPRPRQLCLGSRVLSISIYLIK